MTSTTTSSGEGVLLWALPSGQRLRYPAQTVGTWEEAADVSLSPDGRRLAIASTGLGVRLLDVAAGGRSQVLARGEAVMAVHFTPDGRSIVAGSANGTVRVWSTTTGRPLGGPLAGHTGSVLWESISPDGRTSPQAARTAPSGSSICAPAVRLVPTIYTDLAEVAFCNGWGPSLFTATPELTWKCFSISCKLIRDSTTATRRTSS